MFCATARGHVDTEGLTFEHVMEDIQTLNEWAFEKKLEVTAVSAHAYAHLAEHYALLASGSSLGQGYGPMFVVRPGVDAEEAFSGVVAIPGELTSAFLAARLYAGDFEYKCYPFDQILDVVKSKEVSAGLVIHEGQLTYEREGLELLVDLGAWFTEETGLPLPLGVMVVRRDLGEDTIAKLARVLERSIKYALENRDEALEYAMQWGRGLDKDTCDRFVEMYVNDTTLDFGSQGQQAVRELLKRGIEAGVIDKEVALDFVAAPAHA